MVQKDIHEQPDLIIGAADKYSWKHVKNWAKSISQSGFTGDAILLTYRVDDDVLLECGKNNITTISVDWDSWGNPIKHETMNRDTQCHQLRFFHIWQLLKGFQPDEYRNIIITDVRDVIFQTNPSEWLKIHLGGYQIIAPSEGVTFGKESWNMTNVHNAFGPYVAESTNPYKVFNVGTIAGKFQAMKELCLSLYLMGVGHQIPNDQAAFNILVNGLISELTLKLNMDSTWSCQCGTAVDPEKQYLRDSGAYTDVIPDMVNGLICFNDVPYVMVHQYDRVPDWKPIIDRRYR